MGWERANFFAPPGSEPVIEYSWGKQNWLPWSAAEQVNTRTAVTVFDQTSFSKYVLAGPDAEAALQWLCTADVAVPVGKSVYTGLLNERGTYESDVTVTRTGAHEFLIVSSAATTERDKDHIRKNLPAGAHAELVDVTSSMAVFGVMGPKSRELLSSLTDADLSDAAFPFATSQVISLGYATVRATRITYVGELGWELYVPAEFAVGVYEDLLSAGERFGIARGGYYAIESMRLEKGYRAFGRELTPNDNPVEAGLLFACKLKSDIDFLGRAAVAKAKSEGPRRRLVSFAVGSPEPMLWGGELILRDGVVAGQVSSAAWGATTGACVGLGYVRSSDDTVVTPDWVRAGSYTVNVGGETYPITVSLRPIYDPANERVR
jgi:4-methylaminobutanoate oxidase (formaldehyde-forming)